MRRPKVRRPPRRTRSERARRRPGLLAWVAAALALAVGLVSVLAMRPDPPPPDFRARADMARAEAFTRALLAKHEKAPARLSHDEVLALGYLERLRMGLGSPFRLMDHALADPRLAPAVRPQVALALLRRTAEGAAYEIDPLALDALLLSSVPRDARPAAARRHLALIEGTVAQAEDPVDGEAAVRMAYALAEAERTVSRQAPKLAAQAAALVRDRALAREDARMLLAAATRADRHPLALVREWRAARRLRVEAPPGAPRTAAEDVAGAAAALPLAAAIASVADPGETVDAPPVRPLPGPLAARRMAQLARKQQPPPQAPVAVTVERYRALLLDEMGRAGFRESAERLVEHGRSEEVFAAEHARLAALHADPVLSRTALEAAVGLRAYAQERVWFPGFAAPTEAELTAAYGLAAVRFGDEVPIAWRPYYRRMLADALTDLESVLPNLDLRGVSFRVGRSGREGTALAVHEPGRRVIVLPPGSGAGSIAHEVAHDLDWQVGRRRFGRTGAYGTDLAMEASGADRFATAVRGLPAPPATHVRGAARERFETRPAETFARLFDGYVSATLAARGRSNGYLSSFQDEVLTGHGTAVAPTAGRNAETFLPLLMEASPLSGRLQDEILRLWGPGRRPGIRDAVREIAAAPVGGLRRAHPPLLIARDALPADARGQVDEVLRRRAAVLRARMESTCANPLLWLGAGGESAFRRVVDEAAEARIRAVLRVQAEAWRVDLDPRVMRAAWIEPLPAAPPADAAMPFRRCPPVPAR